MSAIHISDDLPHLFCYDAAMKIILSLALAFLYAISTPMIVLAQSLDTSETELIQSAYAGDLAVVQKLVKNGTPVNITGDEHRTPLILAAYNGHTTVVEFLLGAGAEINAQDGGGYTALMYACKRSFDETAQFLLKNGADVNLRSKKKGVTALMIAAALGNVKMVSELLDQGANTDIKDRFGATAAVLAKKRGHTEVVDLIEGRQAEAGSS